jgi:hypothetical protein
LDLGPGAALLEKSQFPNWFPTTGALKTLKVSDSVPLDGLAKILALNPGIETFEIATLMDVDSREILRALPSVALVEILCAHLNPDLRLLSLVGLDTTPLDRLFCKLSSVTKLTLIYEYPRNGRILVSDFPTFFPQLVKLTMKLGDYGRRDAHTLRKLVQKLPKMENLRYLALGAVPHGWQYRWNQVGATWWEQTKVPSQWSVSLTLSQTGGNPTMVASRLGARTMRTKRSLRTRLQ